MSLGSSLGSALSGLSAASRAAEVISSNVANAMTEGYGRREVNLAARVTGTTGQGVEVQGITRHSDLAVIGDRRIAQASSGANTTVADFMAQLETALGTSDSATSLSSRVSDFDTALREAASRPDSDARLAAVLQSATALTAHIANVSTTIQKARSTAESQITGQVEQLNTALSRVAKYNGDIAKGMSNGQDVSALVDQRQQAIDSISAIIPLREVQRDFGGVALYSTGGGILLDGKPAVFDFTPVGVIVPEMSLAGGAMSGLTMNGRAVATDGNSSPITGGTLASAFSVRDRLAPEAQANLDAVARDLIGRFADPAVDPSRASGAAGLFTDGGQPFSAAQEVGLAQRLSVSAAVDPAQGGALWRLRDGLGAAMPGSVGNATLLNTLAEALDTTQAPASGGFSSASRNFSSLAAEMTTYAARGRISAENEASYSAARLQTLKTVELEGGVDTDQEMQSLLLIEKAYAANAKVISVVNGLLQTLLEI
jgi:flagellar hook-associated protein 1